MPIENYVDAVLYNLYLNKSLNLYLNISNHVLARLELETVSYSANHQKPIIRAGLASTLALAFPEAIFNQSRSPTRVCALCRVRLASSLTPFTIIFGLTKTSSKIDKMDQQSVYSLSVLAPDPDASEDSRSHIQAQLRNFILEFRLDNAFIYRFAVCRSISGYADYITAEIRSARMFLSNNTTAMLTSHTSYLTTRSWRINSRLSQQT